mgnify:CR=1 FL=1
MPVCLSRCKFVTATRSEMPTGDRRMLQTNASRNASTKHRNHTQVINQRVRVSGALHCMAEPQASQPARCQKGRCVAWCKDRFLEALHPRPGEGGRATIFRGDVVRPCLCQRVSSIMQQRLFTRTAMLLRNVAVALQHYVGNNAEAAE